MESCLTEFRLSVGDQTVQISVPNSSSWWGGGGWGGRDTFVSLRSSSATAQLKKKPKKTRFAQPNVK